MALALPYCPMIPECSWKKTQIGKKKQQKTKKAQSRKCCKMDFIPRGLSDLIPAQFF